MLKTVRCHFNSYFASQTNQYPSLLLRGDRKVECVSQSKSWQKMGMHNTIYHTRFSDTAWDVSSFRFISVSRTHPHSVSFPPLKSYAPTHRKMLRSLLGHISSPRSKDVVKILTPTKSSYLDCDVCFQLAIFQNNGSSDLGNSHSQDLR